MTYNKKNRIDFLDFMRIFAFLSVLIGHKLFLGLYTLAHDPSNHMTIRYIAEGFLPLCDRGAAGVLIFFFTSGYITTHVLQKETSIEFLIKRVFRIYPLYIFAVLAEELMATHGSILTPLSVLLPRLLLLGDFFDTEYALGGVDWTLRIEIMFYMFMAMLKATGLLKKSALLPAIFVLCTALLHMIGPFPMFAGWTNGYFTLYTPFLFVGSVIYLAEYQMANRKYCIISVMLIFFAFLVLTAKIQPVEKESNNAVYALLLFLAAWGGRRYFSGGLLVLFLSDLTYAVYLFHNWLWSYLETIVIKIGFRNISNEMQIFFALLAVCYITHCTVEKYGIRLGSYILAEYRKRKIVSQ